MPSLLIAPVKRAYEQNTKEVNQWLQEQYPAIAVKAKKERAAEIYWADETGLQTAAHRAQGFSLKGKKTILRVSAKKNGISMVSAINNEGRCASCCTKKA